MPFVGLDLHKQVIEAAIVDDEGKLIHKSRFPATREALLVFAKRWLNQETSVAMEATTNTWPVVDVLEPLVREVVVSNPMRTRAIASAKIMTDAISAPTLAHLLRLNYLPRVWQPDATTRHQRELVTERTTLTTDRTRIKNRIHSVLHQRMIPAPAGDLFSKQNLAWLRALPLSDEGLNDNGRRVLDRYLTQLEAIEKEAATVDTLIAKHAYNEPRVRLLMTLPGVDMAVALGLMAALGEPSRFASADKAAAYFGLVPSTKQSGRHCYHGRITKQGNSHARWLLVQAAQHVAEHAGPLGVFFRKLAKRKNRNVAVVAVARKLVTIAWHMLRRNEPYRYAQPAATESKLSRLRVRATGKRRRGGLPKGQPRPANYGTGQRTRRSPSLDARYAKEGLPPRQTLSPGEARMIAACGLDAYCERLSQDAVKPRARGGKPGRKPKSASKPALHADDHAAHC
jgi:transposase